MQLGLDHNVPHFFTLYWGIFFSFLNTSNICWLHGPQEMGPNLSIPRRISKHSLMGRIQPLTYFHPHSQDSSRQPRHLWSTLGAAVQVNEMDIFYHNCRGK